MIQILCGCIASGKSTYAKQKAKEGWIIINDDAIVNAVHIDYTLYSKKLKPLYKSIENHILHVAVAMGLNVIVDRGLSNTTRSRKRWIALAKSLDVEINAVKFQLFSSITHAERRMASDSRGHNYEYWLKVAQKHLADWEPPLLEEGFDCVEEVLWKE